MYVKHLDQPSIGTSTAVESGLLTGQQLRLGKGTESVARLVLDVGHACTPHSECPIDSLRAEQRATPTVQV
jgi:hypothetical protein